MFIEPVKMAVWYFLDVRQCLNQLTTESFMACMTTKKCFVCGHQYMGDFYTPSTCPKCDENKARELRMIENKNRLLAKVRRKSCVNLRNRNK